MIKTKEIKIKQQHAKVISGLLKGYAFLLTHTQTTDVAIIDLISSEIKDALDYREYLLEVIDN